MAFRLNQILAQYFTDDGQVLSGGTLTFYENLTTTPKNTYTAPALSVANPNPLTIESDGRPGVDIWGSGVYTVVLKNSLGSTLETVDYVQSDGEELPDPSTGPGEFLQSNGTDYVLAEIDVLPAPGDNGDVLQVVGGEWVSDAPPPVNNYEGDELHNAVLYNIRYKTQTVTAAATTTIDYALGGVVILNQAVDISSLVLSNFGSAGEAAVMTIFRVKDATATPRTIDWGTFLLPGGTAPTLTQTSGGRDAFSIMTPDGTNVYVSANVAFAVTP